MEHIKSISNTPLFRQQGLDGYGYNLECKEISLNTIDCFKGHDKYHTNPYSTHIYYVLDGEGKFKINNQIFNVKKDDCIEIPKNAKFVYEGKMKLLLIMSPAFRPQDGIVGEDNDLYDKGE